MVKVQVKGHFWGVRPRPVMTAVDQLCAPRGARVGHEKQNRMGRGVFFAGVIPASFRTSSSRSGLNTLRGQAVRWIRVTSGLPGGCAGVARSRRGRRGWHRRRARPHADLSIGPRAGRYRSARECAIVSSWPLRVTGKPGRLLRGGRSASRADPVRSLQWSQIADSVRLADELTP